MSVGVSVWESEGDGEVSVVVMGTYVVHVCVCRLCALSRP